MVGTVHPRTALVSGAIRDPGLTAQKLHAAVEVRPGDEEGDGVLGSGARAAQFHPDADVGLGECEDAIEVPRVEVDLVHGGREHEDAIDLTQAMSGQGYFHAVHQGVLHARGTEELDVEDFSYIWYRKSHVCNSLVPKPKRT